MKIVAKSKCCIYSLTMVIILASCSVNNITDRKDWPYSPIGTRSYASIYRTSAIYDGTIVLKSGDSISGKIKLLPYLPSLNLTYLQLLPKNKTDVNDILNINRNKIAQVRLSAPLPFDSSGNTYLFTMGDNELWRLIKRKGQISIYDGIFNYLPKGRCNATMLMTNPHEKIMISPRFLQGVFYADAVRPFLLDFIKKRYHENFKSGYFKNDQSIIQYIVRKENERLLDDK